MSDIERALIAATLIVGIAAAAGLIAVVASLAGWLP